MRHATASLALSLVVAGRAATACAEIAPQVADVIALTRETRATYSVFSWNLVTDRDGNQREEWAAEFNLGKLHRVETPRARIVADCEAMTGAYLDLDTGEVSHMPRLAYAACGIQANSTVESATITGSETSQFGRVINLRIIDNDAERTYVVAQNGALVGATIMNKKGRGSLNSFAVAMIKEAPLSVFSEASLSTSAVPVKYRVKPELRQVSRF